MLTSYIDISTLFEFLSGILDFLLPMVWQVFFPRSDCDGAFPGPMSTRRNKTIHQPRCMCWTFFWSHTYVTSLSVACPPVFHPFRTRLRQPSTCVPLRNSNIWSLFGRLPPCCPTSTSPTTSFTSTTLLFVHSIHPRLRHSKTLRLHLSANRTPPRLNDPPLG